MICAEFDAKLDLYIDAMLPPKEHLDYVEHLGSCRACTESVLGYQKVRALLTTAVTDRVAAVDVSGLWERIAARLPDTSSPVAGHVVTRVAPAETGLGSEEGLLGRVGANLTRLFWPSSFPGRFGMGVATAALAFIVFSIGSSTSSTPNSTNQPRPHAEARNVRGAEARNVRGAVRPVRIDSIEVAAGHTVSTWVKPRTRTRVIWVADADLESFGVGNASHTR